jgi:DNA-binding CsgD family transcriptional regulator
VDTWHLDPAPGPQPLAADAVALLLDAPSQPAPAASMLAFLNALVPVDYLSLVEYVPQAGGRDAAPELIEGHARPGVANVTPGCFAHYRRHYWRHDHGTRLAHQVGRGAGAQVAAMHLRADDVPLEAWRREIYDGARLADRLSFYWSPAAGATFAINLYRDRSQGPFRRGELDRLLGVAPLLRRAHRACAGAAASAAPAGDLAQRVARADEALRRRAPELSGRERAVCARIACGLSADGIAVDLDVAPSTVATLRKRAYGKLASRGLTAGRLQLAAFVR